MLATSHCGRRPQRLCIRRRVVCVARRAHRRRGGSSKRAAARSSPMEAAASPSRSTISSHSVLPARDRPDTTDPSLESWVPVPPDSDFPIQNLAVRCLRRRAGMPRIGVAIGDEILDCRAVAEAGFFDDCCEPELLQAPVLNPLLAAGRSAWGAVRERLSLTCCAPAATIGCATRRPIASSWIATRSTMRVPMEIGDYVDFYSSIEHATNLGTNLSSQCRGVVAELALDAGRISRTLGHDRHRRHAGAPAARAAQAARCARRRTSVRKPAPRHRARDGLRDRARQSTRRANRRRRCRRAYLRARCWSTIGARATFRRGSINRSAHFSASRLRRRSRLGS